MIQRNLFLENSLRKSVWNKLPSNLVLNRRIFTSNKLLTWTLGILGILLGSTSSKTSAFLSIFCSSDRYCGGFSGRDGFVKLLELEMILITDFGLGGGLIGPSSSLLLRVETLKSFIDALVFSWYAKFDGISWCQHLQYENINNDKSIRSAVVLYQATGIVR